MVDVIEESFNVALDKPLGRSKILLHLYQCGVATAFGSETVRGVLKTTFINCFQQHSQYLLH